jgi:hypothetical protein
LRTGAAGGRVVDRCKHRQGADNRCQGRARIRMVRQINDHTAVALALFPEIK